MHTYSYGVLLYSDGRMPSLVALFADLYQFCTRYVKSNNDLCSAYVLTIARNTRQVNTSAEHRSLLLVSCPPFSTYGLGVRYICSLAPVGQAGHLQHMSQNDKGGYSKQIEGALCRKMERRINTDVIRWSGFRTNNNRLPKITGRYMKPKVERHQRVCTLCNDGKVRDEYHLIFECTHRTVSIFRKKYVPKFYSERPSMMQYMYQPYKKRECVRQ